jgi:putative oxidoreductase
MRVIERASQALLGWVFVQAGAGVLRKPEIPAAKAAPVLGAVRSAAPIALPDDVVLVRLNAAVQVAAGAALCAGRVPRLAALTLLGSIVPTTAGGHRFWEVEAGPERNTQRNHLLKNVSIAGGLLHVATTPHAARRKD